ncbi:hypothetical protein J7643_14935 [bacterium]|nr:hypothetical protein [bacterium]
MRIGSFGASLLIHALVLGALVFPAGSAARRVPPMPLPTPNITVALVALEKLQPKTVEIKKGTIQYPDKKKPEPKPTPTPKPAATPKVAAKPTPAPAKVATKPKPAPTPRPTPSAKPVDKDHATFEALRQYKEYAGLTDEQIRKMPLPPGMKDWKSVLAMTKELDKLDWTQPPPDTGDKTKKVSGGGFFGWAPSGLGQSTEYMGGPAREQVDGKWRYAFQYFGAVMVAEWVEGADVAKVAYYPYGQKPDESKTFEISVKPKDEDMSAEMIAQYTLISMGQAPMPVSRQK